MLRVTMELVPYGVETSKRTIGVIEIGNTGAGSPFLGSYIFRRFSEDGRKIKEGAIGEFKRKQYNAWTLLAAILDTLELNKPEAWKDGKPSGRLL